MAALFMAAFGNDRVRHKLVCFLKKKKKKTVLAHYSAGRSEVTPLRCHTFGFYLGKMAPACSAKC